MAWALETTRTGGRFAPSVYNTLAAVQNAVDYTHPAEWYPVARMLRRKVHMHVGPTNSGKTHNALRALAASKRGVYASPLRLLAYEVFDRLNKGHIVPLDADPSTPRELCKRQCDLLTGEEVRNSGLDSPLLSCTVEMIDVKKRYEVAVIDEVQMLSDSERGGHIFLGSNELGNRVVKLRSLPTIHGLLLDTVPVKALRHVVGEVAHVAAPSVPLVEEVRERVDVGSASSTS